MVDYNMIPPHIMGGLERYRDNGTPPGNAIRAALANDLQSFVAYADEECIAATRHIVGWIYNKLPMKAHGGYDKVDAWIEETRKK